MVEELLHFFCCFECNSLFAIGCVKGCSKHVSSVVAATKYCNLTPCRIGFHPFSKHPNDRQRHDRIPRCSLRLDVGQFSPHFGAPSLLNQTEAWRKRKNSTGNLKIHWRVTGDDAPKLQISVPCRECVLKIALFLPSDGGLIAARLPQ